LPLFRGEPEFQKLLATTIERLFVVKILSLASSSIENVGASVVDVVTTTASTKAGLAMDSADDVMQFDDGTDTLMISRVPRPLIADSLGSSMELGTFLERWTSLQLFTWASTSSLGTLLMNMDPWYLLLSNTAISKKLAGFRRLHAKLHVRCVLNASATQYGAVTVAALPQGTESYTDPYVTNSTGAIISGTLPLYHQLFHMDFCQNLYPSRSNSVEFDLPWVSPLDAIDLLNLSSSGGGQTQWRILMYVLAPLGNSTNNSTVTSVTIRCFARLTDVSLDMPYPQSTVSSGRSQGTVGRISAAVASTASSLKNVPFLSSFAAGTEVLASAVGAVADHFGFTRANGPPLAHYVGLSTVRNTVHADVVDTDVSLSVLSGNKVSIDPSLGGTDQADQLSFADFCSRRHLHPASTSWTCSNAAGTVLATWPVSPIFGTMVGGSSPRSFYPSPLSFVALWFAYWRGSMEYEIEVLASSQHRGRLQLVYYPATVTATEDATNSSYNVIWEIDSNSVKKFRIGWAATSPALYVNGVNLTTFTPNNHNGYLQLIVQNELCAPDPNAAVYVIIYGRAGADFQLFRTIEPGPALVLQLQAGMEPDMHDLVPTKAGDASSIICGEVVQSIRTLIQKPCLTYVFQPYTSAQASTANGVLTWWIGTEFLPAMNANNYYTPDSAFGLLPYTTSYLRWFSRAFLGFRGSRRFKFVPLSSSYNIVTHGTPFPVFYHQAGLSFGSEDYTFNLTYSGLPNSDPTILPNDAKTAGSLEVRAPYYGVRRYNLSRLTPSNTAAFDPAVSNFELVQYHAQIGAVDTQAGASQSNQPVSFGWESAGEDFSFATFRFIGALSYIPTPN
jgi:hypothetical protein